MIPGRGHAGPSQPTPADRKWAADVLDDFWGDPDGTEALAEGGTHLLDLVSAVDYLARGLRHDFTVWDALEEAVRWWLADQASPVAGDPGDGDSDSPDEDPLRARLVELLDHVADERVTAADALQQAVRRWTTTMAERFNAGYHWPHPARRRGFPPPRIGP